MLSVRQIKTANIAILHSLILIAISLSMAAQVVPDDFLAENEKEIRETGSVGSSPEDWTSVWGWITFNWCSPLIKRGALRFKTTI